MRKKQGMILGWAVLVMVAMNAQAETSSDPLFDPLESAEELNIERDRSPDEVFRDYARHATSIAAGQILQTPDGCLYSVLYRDGDAVLAPVLDDKLEKKCVTDTL